MAVGEATDTEMALSQTSGDPPRCCFCFSVRVSTLCLAVYHMVLSMLLLAEHSVEVAKGKDRSVSLHDYYKIAEIASSFLLIIMLFLISVCLLFGVSKNRENFLLPFLSLQVLDFLLSSLTLCSTYIELPAYLQFSPANDATLASQEPFTIVQILDFVLSLLTLCSSYMEIPAYLNFKSMNHMNYFPSKKVLSPQKSTKMLIFYSIICIVVLLLKAFMMNCVWRCFKSIRDSRKGVTKETPQHNFLDKIILPSYEEAMKMSTECLPPPYTLA